MNISAHTRPSTNLRQQMWLLYQTLFTDINQRAAQRHLMHLDEFEAVMADQFVDKYVGTDEEGVAAIGAMTRHLDHAPLISPEFYRRRFGTELAYQRRIFYVMFIGVDQSAPTGYTEMIHAMSEPIHAARGVACLDLCARNLTERRIGAATTSILKRRYENVRYQVDDTQTFVSYDFRDRP